MSIEKIRLEDIPSVHRRSGREESEERVAIKVLEVGEALRFPCRWNHSSDTGKCSGHSLVNNIARKNNVKFTARCNDGVFYVGRIA